MDLVAENLGELADILHSGGQRIAFEFLSWSTAALTWSNAWEVVKISDRPNLGLCIESQMSKAIEILVVGTTCRALVVTVWMPEGI